MPIFSGIYHFYGIRLSLNESVWILGAVLEAGALSVADSVIGMQFIWVQYSVYTLGCELACARAAMQYDMMVKVGRCSAVDRLHYHRGKVIEVFIARRLTVPIARRSL